ncbi:phage tail fiber protein [Rhizobium rhizogenes]
MASYNRVVFSGGVDTISVPFPYLDQSHVQVYLDGIRQMGGYSWLSAGQVQLDTAPGAGVVGEVRRVTPTGPIVTFTSGDLDKDDLNVASLQPLYIAEEGRDYTSDLYLRSVLAPLGSTGLTLVPPITDYSSLVKVGPTVIGGPNPFALASLIGQAGEIEAHAYDSRDAVALAHVKSTIYSIQTGGYAVAGDGGAALYRRVSTMPSHLGRVQSADGAWWELANIVVSPRMFGARVDGSDSAAGIQAAFDLGRPIVIDGHYTALSRITRSGSVYVSGYDKANSSITWPSVSTSVGIEVIPSSDGDKVCFSDFSVYVGATANNVLSVDWSGHTTVDFFSPKFEAVRLNILAVGSGLFSTGIYLNYPNNARIDLCYIQNQVSLSGVTAASYPAVACIYIDNTLGSNSDILEVSNNRLFAATTGLFVKYLEGCVIHNNDIQVCWDGIVIQNTVKVNQYRIHTNHIGVFNTGVSIYNARHVLLHDNEISYRIGRTDTATVDNIRLEQVQFADVADNTIRGNYSALGTITVRGVELVSTVSGDPTIGVRVHGNSVLDLADGIVLTSYVNNYIHYGNVYYRLSGNPLVNNILGTGAVAAFRLGEGSQLLGGSSQTPVSGQNFALWVSKANASCVGLNRDAAGAVQNFYNGTSTVVGSISITASSTVYGTSSDYRLKSDVVDLTGSGAFIEALRPRRFVLNGVEQCGFIAHELAEVSPLSVSGTKDGVDEEGNPLYQTIQAGTSEIIAFMVAELQSLRSRVATLEAA